eukprot:GHUV01014514.1.p1 GENE.GHUV01014514.1~~GHUV01014514.1.p1  ORF type:complete len:123 (+),score=19.30 GHUV01014514.1:356-724(+)
MSSTKREPEEELDADSPANKRVKLEANGSADGVKPQIEPEAEAEGADAAVKQEEAEDDGEEEFIPLPQSTTRSAVKRGHECPYLDTILRQVRLEPCRTAAIRSYLQLPSLHTACYCCWLLHP